MKNMHIIAILNLKSDLQSNFSKLQIKEMLIKSGFENILFSEEEPYWCVLGHKKDRSKS